MNKKVYQYTQLISPKAAEQTEILQFEMKAVIDRIMIAVRDRSGKIVDAGMKFQLEPSDDVIPDMYRLEFSARVEEQWPHQGDDAKDEGVFVQEHVEPVKIIKWHEL